MSQENMQKTVEELEQEIAHFKQSMNEWIMFLSDSQKEIRERLMEMEKRISRVEMDSKLGFYN